ncbi:Transcription factor [Nymphaea thermarum]|nr:Transcription factor [Nymphaea thermarum]
MFDGRRKGRDKSNRESASSTWATKTRGWLETRELRASGRGPPLGEGHLPAVRAARQARASHVPIAFPTSPLYPLSISSCWPPHARVVPLPHSYLFPFSPSSLLLPFHSSSLFTFCRSMDQGARSCAYLLITKHHVLEDVEAVDLHEPMAKQANMVDENSVGRRGKTKDKGAKKIHKAEREKLKRDHLNELFSDLGQSLEPARQNNGKATILSDATRILRDLLTEVDHLRKENAALLTESRYITDEKNELKDENAVLEAEIGKLQSQLQERTPSEPMWSNSAETLPSSVPGHLGRAMLSSTNNQLVSPVAEPLRHLVELDASGSDQNMPSVGGPAMLSTDQVLPRPLLVFPLHPDLQNSKNNSGRDSDKLLPQPAKPPSNVRRPHARYPTPSDSWPSRLLTRHPREHSQEEHCGARRTEKSGNDDDASNGNLSL